MCRRMATAPRGRYEEVRPLAMVIRSGTVFQCSIANHLPVRPKPAITSSATIRMPWRSQSSRTPWMYPSGGIRMPLVPTIVSRKIAAMVCGPSYMITSSRPLKALFDRPRLALTPAMRIGIPDNADQPGFRRPAAGIAGERHRTHRRPVIRPVPGEDLVSAGVLASDLDRVLDGLGAAEREEDLVEISGEQRRSASHRGALESR